jgi:molybdate transport system permease protein
MNDIWQSIDLGQILWLTFKLAGITTLLLLCIAVPLGWWLARGQTIWRHSVGAIVTLPLVLPPSVLGFYILLAFSPNNALGGWLRDVVGVVVPFSFPGLVLGACLFSLPFVVHPIRNSFSHLPQHTLDAAATLGAGRFWRFITVAIPLCRSGIYTGCLLGFAHTVGEFGVVLMIGGNIPGETQVASVALYALVAGHQQDAAHWLAGAMVLFAFIVITVLSLLQGRGTQGAAAKAIFSAWR